MKRENKPLGNANPNRYTPPALRPPTAHATVTGAPVDPAIISSQLARTDANSEQQQPKAKDLAPAAAPTNKDDSESMIGAPSSLQAGVGSIEGGSQQPKQTSNITTQAAQATTDTSPSKSSGIASSSRATAGATNATATVEKDLLKAFKHFSGTEKMKMQEQNRKFARQEREVKLNDLKKFATNFKLKTAVPPDMLGILAKDKERQETIVKKSHRQLEEQVAASKAPVPPPSEPSNQRPSTSTRPEPGNAAVDQPSSSSRGNRSHGGRGRGDRSLGGPLPMMPPRGAGQPSLGQRLMAQQSQYAQRQVPPIMPLQDMRIAPPAPGPLANDAPGSRGATIPTPTSANSSRFNAQALEFRPNPTASTFSPTGPPSGASNSPAGPKAAAKAKVTNRVSFFGDKRPGPISEKRSIKDAFNPIQRMKKEAERDNKAKDFAVNGGIPQAYRTPPTWDVREENLEKSYEDMFENNPPIVQSASPANAPMPHQHQLPPHLQPGAPPIPQIHHTPQPNMRHSYGGPMPQGPRGDHSFDEHRMHVSSSNQSMYNSPRFQQQNLVPHIGSPMFSQAQPAAYGQPQQVIMGMGPNGQPVRYIAQMPGGQQFTSPQGGQMGGPQMMGGQPGGFMTVPVQPQQMQVYQSPAPPHAFPAHLNGPQTTNGYSSPYAAPLMTPRGSQQGQAPPYVHLTPSQQGQQIYPQQSQQPQSKS